jgi:hypothetical protein
MAPKYHHTPLSGGDRKALKKELVKSRAMTRIFAERSEEKRRVGEGLIREADNLACQSWNEKMWSDGGPIDPSPTIDQAINGGSKSNARDARPRATLISAPCAGGQRHACTISLGGARVPKVQDRRQAPGRNAAPACAAPATAGLGGLGRRAFECGFAQCPLSVRLRPNSGHRRKSQRCHFRKSAPAARDFA